MLTKKISLNSRLKKSSKKVANKVLPYQICVLYGHLFNELIFGGKKSDTERMIFSMIKIFHLSNQKLSLATQIRLDKE